ncbi:peptidoglycan D,D-transpeptidase FtsI family protein [Dictyobacter arantiisoli]|uniref:Beta-lactamase n=1 Tax=Dictyobacter arantiisoli TaxID=2014874 RepID=A0A5A5TJ40_9CHLR|nr:penicillin-binding transpeptidase domain-containing protein [Dictyobacter arantiisoli]GCF11437.1 beta-lactamase [Dictyobacter arantiisoli]
MNISTSIRKLTYVFVILFVGLSGGLVYWQVVNADNVTSTIHNPRRCLAENNPVRGRIFDRNGVLLAESVPAPASMGCSGGYIRKYTEPSLANIIGYYVPGYSMFDGIEKQYNDVLSGKTGSSALTNEVNKILHKSAVGNDIYLTIDSRIQRLAVQEFNDYHPTTDPFYFQSFITPTEQAYTSDRGSMVISNPHTGEILAMVSSPGYDPNKMVQTLSAGDLSYYNSLIANPANPLLDRPLTETTTPGSTFKTVTLMGALDSGATTLDTRWDRKAAAGPLYYDGSQIIGDNLGIDQGFTRYFPINTEYAYANSDNIVFAQIGVKMGQQTWLDYARKLYIDQQVPFDLPVKTSNVQTTDGTPLSTLQLASNAFGQGVDNITPFQMSLVDNTVANNGVLMRPMLVSKITDNSKNVLTSSSPQQLNTVVSSDTAYKVRQAMDAVATCGSAWHLDDNFGYNYSIAGKTGTGEIGGGQHAQGWMITQAPFTLNDPNQMPAVTITAVRENGGEGAYAIGPAIWKTYNDIFSKGYVKANFPTPRNPNTWCQPNNLWQQRLAN